jgi:hypothetical protein
MMHILLVEDEATMVQLMAASLEATAMAFYKMRMNISGIDKNAPILLSVELSKPFVTHSNLDNIITFLSIKLSYKKQ